MYRKFKTTASFLVASAVVACGYMPSPATAKPMEPACELIFAYSTDVLNPAVSSKQFEAKWAAIVKSIGKDGQSMVKALSELDEVLLRAVNIVPRDKLHLVPDALRKQCYMEFGV